MANSGKTYVTLRLRLAAAEHEIRRLTERAALVDDLHAQLDRANAAAVRMARWALSRRSL